jgi:hypothetical protein
VLPTLEDVFIDVVSRAAADQAPVKSGARA